MSCEIMDRDRPELRHRQNNTTCSKTIKKCDIKKEFITMPVTSICCNVNNCKCGWVGTDLGQYNPLELVQASWTYATGVTCEDCLESFVRTNHKTRNSTFQLFQSHHPNSILTRTLTLGHSWISAIKKSGIVHIKKLLNKRACFSIPFITILLLSLINPCYMYDSLKNREENVDSTHQSTGSARSSRSFYDSSSANSHHRENSSNRHGQHKSHDASPTPSSQQFTQPSSCASCVEIRKELKVRNLEFIKNQVLMKLGFTQAPNISSIPKMSAQRVKELMRNWSASLPGMDFGMQGDDPNIGDGDSFGDMWSEGQNLWKEGISVHEEDNNDFHAKTEKVIAFAKPYPRLRHSWKEHDILQFRFSDKILRHRIKEAILNVYVKPPPLPSSRKKRALNKTNSVSSDNPDQVLLNRSKRNSDDQSQKENDYISIVPTAVPTSEMKDETSLTISVYKVFKNSKGKNPDAPSFELVTSENIYRSDFGTAPGKWIPLDISTMLSTWFKSPRDNWGFVVRAEDENGVVFDVQHIKSEDDSKVPYCELFTIDMTQRRKKRSYGIDCTENSDENRCCRYPLTVDFQEFGWDWIIAPKQYRANYCSGECGYAFLQKYPHTHIASLAKQPETNPAVEACCAPRKMSAISMLYFDHELNIIFGSLPNMVVDRCGCS